MYSEKIRLRGSKSVGGGTEPFGHHLVNAVAVHLHSLLLAHLVPEVQSEGLAECLIELVTISREEVLRKILVVHGIEGVLRVDCDAPRTDHWLSTDPFFHLGPTCSFHDACYGFWANTSPLIRLKMVRHVFHHKVQERVAGFEAEECIP